MIVDKHERLLKTLCGFSLLHSLHFRQSLDYAYVTVDAVDVTLMV